MLNNARRSSKSKIKASAFLQKVFQEHLKDEAFHSWFIHKFNFKGNELDTLINYDLITTSTSSKLLPKEIRQDVYNFWKENSKGSVCRSNDRHLVNIIKKNINIQTDDLDDDDIDPNLEHLNRVKPHRKFTIHTHDELHKIYSNTEKISLSAFVSLKPFYIGPVTDREKETCLCIDCLNPHCIYNAIRHLLNKNKLQTLPRSLTEYLCQEMVCEKDEKLTLAK